MSPPISNLSLAEDIKSAVEQDRFTDLEVLLSNWSSPDLNPLQPALCTALTKGYINAIDLLLKRGCECGFDATTAALRGGHIPAFKCMVKYNWDINYSLDHRGDALICALKFHPPQLARWLLKHGADPNANLGSDPLAGTALEAACAARCPTEIISLLIYKGADIKGSIAILVAAWTGYSEALSILLDSGADIDIIPIASSSDLLLEGYWGTALHGAAAKGQAETVRFLLTKGARKDIRNNAGRTAMETAEYFGQVECASILNDDLKKIA